MKVFFNYFLIFFVYSVIGWITESAYVGFKEKKFIDRGFLIGPYCPIYGCGALGMILYLNQYKDNIVTVFFLAVIICSILEYVTSYVMEKLFNARWWDYSDQLFNLNGRVCGKNSILFGFGGIIIIYFVHPFLNQLFLLIDSKLLTIVTIICFIIFCTDLITSFNIIHRFKNTVSNITSRKDSTQEFTRLVREKLKLENSFLQTRLFSAFPNVDLSKLIKINKGFFNIKDIFKK